MNVNVNPGFINPWLILIGGCPLSLGVVTFGGNNPPNDGTGLLMLGQQYPAGSR